MTRSWAALLLAALLACDGGGKTTPGTAGTGGGTAGGGGAGGKGGADAGTDAAPTVPGRITLTNITPPGGAKLLWVGFADGDGPWQTVSGAGNTYAFQVQEKRYGLAFVCQGSLGNSGEVVHTTPAELPALTVDCGVMPSATRTVRGKIVGLAPEASVQLQFGGPTGSWELATIPAPVTMYMGQVPPGVFDLAAFSSVSGRPAQAVIVRDLAAAGDAVVDLDFAKDGVALVEQPLTIRDGTAVLTSLSSGVTITTGRARFLALNQALGPVTSYRGFPAAALRPGDTQTLGIAVEDPGMGQSYRGIFRGVREPRPLDLTLPPRWVSPQVAIPPMGAVRPYVTFEPQPGALYYQLLIAQSVGSRLTDWLAIFSAAWLEGAARYEFPDFSAAAGFQPAFVFDRQGLFEWSCDTVTSTRDFDHTINESPEGSDGALMTWARKSDQIIVP